MAVWRLIVELVCGNKRLQLFFGEDVLARRARDLCRALPELEFTRHVHRNLGQVAVFLCVVLQHLLVEQLVPACRYKGRPG